MSPAAKASPASDPVDDRRDPIGAADAKVVSCPQHARPGVLRRGDRSALRERDRVESREAVRQLRRHGLHSRRRRQCHRRQHCPARGSRRPFRRPLRCRSGRPPRQRDQPSRPRRTCPSSTAWRGSSGRPRRSRRQRALPWHRRGRLGSRRRQRRRDAGRMEPAAPARSDVPREVVRAGLHERRLGAVVEHPTRTLCRTRFEEVDPKPPWPSRRCRRHQRRDRPGNDGRIPQGRCREVPSRRLHRRPAERERPRRSPRRRRRSRRGSGRMRAARHPATRAAA